LEIEVHTYIKIIESIDTFVDQAPIWWLVGAFNEVDA
jgi:hypothetical protein